MKTLRIFLVFLLAFCFASSAFAAPKIPDKYNKEFLEHYKFFIDKNTRKSFEKLTTDPERDDFISNFWKERDTDPNTPENEFKEEVDQRFVDIQNEVYSSDPDIAGVRFANEGGLNGDMARVYLLHGEPDLKFKRFEGHNHVDLMLWLYADESGQYPKYLFLFYRKYDVGPLQVFRNHSMYLEWALAEISRFGVQGVNEIYQELQWTGGQEGQLILFALTQFSFDSSIHVDEALDPPRPASLIAKKSKSRVVGQPDIAKELNIIYSKENSFIPANLEVITTSTLETPENKSIGISLGIKYGDLDWVIQGEQLKCTLELKLVVQNKQTKEVNFYSWTIDLMIPKAKLAEDPNFYRSIPLDEFVAVLNKGPVGAYRINAYLKNVLTNKYNAWLEEIIK